VGVKRKSIATNDVPAERKSAANPQTADLRLGFAAMELRQNTAPNEEYDGWILRGMPMAEKWRPEDSRVCRTQVFLGGFWGTAEHGEKRMR